MYIWFLIKKIWKITNHSKSFSRGYLSYEIRSNQSFRVKINFETNTPSNLKSIDIKEEYGLQFLNDKLIFKEHIFNNKTNVEEELLAEMKQLSNVGIELKENEQNSMIPHEIIEDLDNFFESCIG